MPIKENQTASDLLFVLDAEFSVSASDILTAAVDTKDYDNGVTFIPWWILWSGVAPSTVNFKAVEDSEDGTTDWQTVPSDQIVAQNFPVLANIPQYAAGNLMSTLGVVGTRRYVRGVIDVAIAGGTIMNLMVLINAGPEIKRGVS